MSDIDILPELRQRRSLRAFDPHKTLDMTALAPLLEAARWAPSGGNGQPWRWLIGLRGDETFAAILELLMPFNQVYAKHACALILSAAQVTRQNANGETVTNRTAFYDVGLANMSLAVEATRRGMNLRMMGGFDLQGARALLAKDLDAVCVIALGWANDGSQLPAEIQEREKMPRERKPINQMVLKLEN